MLDKRKCVRRLCDWLNQVKSGLCIQSLYFNKNVFGFYGKKLPVLHYKMCYQSHLYQVSSIYTSLCLGHIKSVEFNISDGKRK